MACLNVVRVKGGALAIECQSDSLSHLASRFVVPLLAPDELPGRIAGLHPEFVVAGKPFIMATHLAGAIPKRGIEAVVGSLREEQYAIQRALDLLTGSGF